MTRLELVLELHTSRRSLRTHRDRVLEELLAEVARVTGRSRGAIVALEARTVRPPRARQPARFRVVAWLVF